MPRKKRKPLPLRDFLMKDQGTSFNRPKEGTKAWNRLQDMLAKLAKQGISVHRQPYVLDVFGRGAHHCFDRVPCITSSRGTQGGYYVSSEQRMLSIEEMLSLQGLPRTYAQAAKHCSISDRQMGHMIGNAIAVNVLQLLIVRMLHALQLEH